MKKIISLFQRNYDGDRLVRDEVVPGAEWVVAGEGTPTRKRDGTCCLVRVDEEGHGHLLKRYDAKRGKTPPAGFEAAQPEPDPVTGHWPGWLAVGDGPEDRWHREAIMEMAGDFPAHTFTYTAELVGPRVQSGTEGFAEHHLLCHGCQRLDKSLVDVPRDYDDLRQFFLDHPDFEGIVWWRDIGDQDCDKVKIKRRDFGLPWPAKGAP